MAQAGKVILGLALLAGCATTAGGGRGIRLSLFQSDVTPPLGHPLCGGWIKPIEAVDAPLLLKGVVLTDGTTTCVLAAIDWCVLRGGAYDLFRRKLAAAAGVAEAQVALQCTHTHSAPIADTRAQEILSKTPDAPVHLDLKFMEEATDRAAEALRRSLATRHPVTQVGTGKAAVEGFASNRRVPGPGGKILVRYSATKDPVLKAAPDGLIDPWLRTVTFFDGERPLVRLHYYASHPQTLTGDGRAHGDVAGHAREYLQSEEGVAQIYFTGCAGNVTAGKYNDGSPETRGRIGKALYSGLLRSIADTKKVPVAAFEWKSLDVVLPLRGDPQHSEEALRKVVSDPAVPAARRLQASLPLAWIERVKTRAAVDCSRLRIGPVDILHLPGEAFVEYQLHAQQARPDRFVAVASYGEGGPGYLCLDASYAEGGYEPTASIVAPPTERLLKSCIEDLLR